MRTSTGDKIFAVIQHYRGHDNAIKSTQIAKAIGWPESRERVVRDIISSESVLWPALVCSSPGTGYFICTSYAEAEDYVHWLSDLVEQAEKKRDLVVQICERLGLFFSVVDRDHGSEVAA